MQSSDFRELGAASFQLALDDFRRARLRGLLQDVVARLRGKRAALLSFEEVAQKLQVTNRAASGTRSIPLEAIVGSVGRYNDFTSTFLPRQESDAQRWARVKSVADVSALPPIEVYQLGESYFVLDGNHRVSIARQEGYSHIDADVIQVRTRVPFSPGDDPQTLILKAEQAEFLASTRLDKIRAIAELRVSVCGQYRYLENLIEVHRYFAEVEQEREIGDEEAVELWYDGSYVPTVEAVREQGILRYFPGRTETDFYVWVTRHRVELEKSLGWSLTPGAATSSLAHKMDDEPQGPLTPLANALQRLPLLGGHRREHMPEQSWAEERLAARYSGQLFADILVPFAGKDGDRRALNQALALARLENARIYGLYVGGNSRSMVHVEDDFRQACEEAGIEWFLAGEDGNRVEAICRRSQWADLVVLAPWFVTGGVDVADLVKRWPRPLLLVAGKERPVQRALLLYDGSVRAREALFAAAYMAESWPMMLTVLRQDGRRQHDHATFLGDYLTLHEIKADVESTSEFSPEMVAAAADVHESDLVLMGNPEKGAQGPWGPQAKKPERWLEVLQRPLFLCT